MNAETIQFQVNPSLIPHNLTVIEGDGNLWSITGRIPGKDDDHTHFVLCNGLERAVDAFTYNAYEVAGRDMPHPGDEDYREGEVIYVTAAHEIGVRFNIPVPTVCAEPDAEISEVAEYAPGLPDLPVVVTGLDGAPVQWMVSHNLTDRWGEINTYASHQKPLHELLQQPGLLDALREQMTDELTFVARKDGVFGLLYEVEYECIESDGVDEMVHGLKPYEEVAAALLRAIQQNASRFGPAELCVPPADQICCDRPAVWAFVPNGALDEDDRKELANFLDSISLH